jgi:hypothetical protein
MDINEELSHVHGKIQYFQDVTSSQLGYIYVCIYSQCTSNQISASYFTYINKLILKERQRTQNRQHNIAEQERTRRTDTTPLQDLLQNFADQDDAVLEQTNRSWIE